MLTEAINQFDELNLRLQNSETHIQRQKEPDKTMASEDSLMGGPSKPVNPFKDDKKIVENTNNVREIPLNRPTPFTGDRSKVCMFMQQCMVYLQFSTLHSPTYSGGLQQTPVDSTSKLPNTSFWTTLDAGVRWNPPDSAGLQHPNHCCRLDLGLGLGSG